MDWNLLIERLGVPLAAVVAALYTLARKLWVPGWYAVELERRLDKAEQREIETRRASDELARANAELVNTLRDAVRAPK